MYFAVLDEAIAIDWTWRTVSLRFGTLVEEADNQILNVDTGNLAYVPTQCARGAYGRGARDDGQKKLMWLSNTSSNTVMRRVADTPSVSDEK